MLLSLSTQSEYPSLSLFRCSLRRDHDDDNNDDYDAMMTGVPITTTTRRKTTKLLNKRRPRQYTRTRTITRTKSICFTAAAMLLSSLLQAASRKNIRPYQHASPDDCINDREDGN